MTGDTLPSPPMATPLYIILRLVEAFENKTTHSRNKQTNEQSITGLQSTSEIYKNFHMALQLSIRCGSRQKSAGASLRECAQNARFYPNRFTFGGVIPERVNTGQSALESESNIRLKPIFETNKYRLQHGLQLIMRV